MNPNNRDPDGVHEPDDELRRGANGGNSMQSGDEHERDRAGATDDAYLDRDEDEISLALRESLLADMSPSDRRRIADVQWLHALLDHAHQSRTAERAMQREESLQAALRKLRSEAEAPTTSFKAIDARDSTSFESPQKSPTTAELNTSALHVKRRWLLPVIWSVVTAAAATFAAISLLWGPGETPVNADALLMEAAAAAHKPIDRTYLVEIISANQDRAPISATLDVRGGDCFVFEHPAPLGRAKIGSDGRDFWFVPAVGPVLVRQDSALLESWINRAGSPLPILQITAVLESMSEHFELKRLPDETLVEGGVKLRRVHGRRKSGPSQFPDEIDVWASEQSSVVERTSLHWQDGPLKEITFTLKGETPRADNWYQHGAHHAPHRPVVRGALVPK